MTPTMTLPEPLRSVGRTGKCPINGRTTKGASQAAIARRGRPPGIDPSRREVLEVLVRQGLSLAEIAARLGVTRQCVHAQLRKCAELHAERLARHGLRRHNDRDTQRLMNGLAWAEQNTPGGKALTDFLRQAQAHGWAVHVARRRRPRINGVRLAFHLPQRLRNSPAGQSLGTRYYHFQLTRPDWLHVVCLPTGRYVFYMPDLNRPRGSYYIPERIAYEAQVWPEWSQAVVPKRSAKTALNKTVSRVSRPAWAA